jgi:hypothetical protein
MSRGGRSRAHTSQWYRRPGHNPSKETMKLVGEAFAQQCDVFEVAIDKTLGSRLQTGLQASTVQTIPNFPLSMTDLLKVCKLESNALDKAGVRENDMIVDKLPQPITGSAAMQQSWTCLNLVQIQGKMSAARNQSSLTLFLARKKEAVEPSVPRVTLGGSSENKSPILSAEVYNVNERVGVFDVLNVTVHKLPNVHFTLGLTIKSATVFDPDQWQSFPAGAKIAHVEQVAAKSILAKAGILPGDILLRKIATVTKMHGLANEGNPTCLWTLMSLSELQEKIAQSKGVCFTFFVARKAIDNGVASTQRVENSAILAKEQKQAQLSKKLLRRLPSPQTHMGDEALPTWNKDFDDSPLIEEPSPFLRATSDRKRSPPEVYVASSDDDTPFTRKRSGSGEHPEANSRKRSVSVASWLANSKTNSKSESQSEPCWLESLLNEPRTRKVSITPQTATVSGNRNAAYDSETATISSTAPDFPQVYQQMINLVVPENDALRQDCSTLGSKIKWIRAKLVTTLNSMRKYDDSVEDVDMTTVGVSLDRIYDASSHPRLSVPPLNLTNENFWTKLGVFTDIVRKQTALLRTKKVELEEELTSCRKRLSQLKLNFSLWKVDFETCKGRLKEIRQSATAGLNK